MKIKPVFETKQIEILDRDFGVQTENIIDEIIFEIPDIFENYKIVILFSDENKKEIFEVLLTSSHILEQNYSYKIPDEITKYKKAYYQLICEKYDDLLNSSFLWKSKIYSLYFSLFMLFIFRHWLYMLLLVAGVIHGLLF